jgi:hypothetical protein
MFLRRSELLRSSESEMGLIKQLCQERDSYRGNGGVSLWPWGPNGFARGLC